VKMQCIAFYWKAGVGVLLGSAVTTVYFFSIRDAIAMRGGTRVGSPLWNHLIQPVIISNMVLGGVLFTLGILLCGMGTSTLVRRAGLWVVLLAVGAFLITLYSPTPFSITPPTVQ